MSVRKSSCGRVCGVCPGRSQVYTAPDPSSLGPALKVQQEKSFEENITYFRSAGSYKSHFSFKQQYLAMKERLGRVCALISTQAA